MNSNAEDVKALMRVSNEDRGAALDVVLGVRVRVKQFDPMNHNDGLTYYSANHVAKYMVLAIFEVDGETFENVTVYNAVVEHMLAGLKAA